MMPAVFGSISMLIEASLYMLVDLCDRSWPHQGFPRPLLPRNLPYNKFSNHRLCCFDRNHHQLDYNLFLDGLHMRPGRVLLESRYKRKVFGPPGHRIRKLRKCHCARHYSTGPTIVLHPKAADETLSQGCGRLHVCHRHFRVRRNYYSSPHLDEVQDFYGSHLGLRSCHYLDGARACGRLRLRIATIHPGISG